MASHCTTPQILVPLGHFPFARVTFTSYQSEHVPVGILFAMSFTSSLIAISIVLVLFPSTLTKIWTIMRLSLPSSTCLLCSISQPSQLFRPSRRPGPGPPLHPSRSSCRSSFSPSPSTSSSQFPCPSSSHPFSPHSSHPHQPSGLPSPQLVTLSLSLVLLALAACCCCAAAACLLQRARTCRLSHVRDVRDQTLHEGLYLKCFEPLHTNHRFTFPHLLHCHIHQTITARLRRVFVSPACS